jgi:hypothetical protein
MIGSLSVSVMRIRFLSEYSKASMGVVVCRTPRRFKITPKITAVPWQEIPRLVEELA